MYLCCTIARHVARSTVATAVLGSHARSRLVPVCTSSLKQFQADSRRAMTTDVPEKGAKWSTTDLKEDPETLKEEIHPLDAEKWTTIFRFKYINLLRLAVRMKLYQAVFGFTSLSAVPILSYLGVEVTQEMIMGLLAFNMYIFVVMLGVGHYAQKIVGICYINEPRDKVRVATLTFLGHRRDVMFKLEDIMNISDMNSSKETAFIQFRTFADPDDALYLFLGRATYDRELLELVFGKVPEVPPRRTTKFGRKE